MGRGEEIEDLTYHNTYTHDRDRDCYVPFMRDGLTFAQVTVGMKFVQCRKLLSVKFPTLHMFCLACGAHWHWCCYTEMNPVCVNPVNCAFEKEMWS